MVNVIKLKNRICVEWTVKLSHVGDCTETSEPFMFRNRQCNLVYHSSSSSWIKSLSCHCSNLYFKSTTQLRSPVKVTVLATIPSKTFDEEKHTISGRNQIIWTESKTDLRNKTLTVEVTFDEENQEDTDTRISLESYSKDFTKLLHNGPFHDVEFLFGDQIIKAHKNILCCRSRVFTSMFQNNMVEEKTGRVDIHDMDASIFRQFLECLYTGMLPELTVDTAIQLYKASDKYEVNTLKLQCADFLICHLSLENVCEILVLAELHNDVEFKKNVMKYVFHEKVPVKVAKEKWSDFCNENTNLAFEVYDLFCRYICEK